MNTGILLVAILSTILIIIGIVNFVSFEIEEGGLSGAIIAVFGIAIICCVVSIPTSGYYEIKVLKHKYEIQYINEVNSSNQIVSRDTVLIWK